MKKPRCSSPKTHQTLGWPKPLEKHGKTFWQECPWKPHNTTRTTQIKSLQNEHLPKTSKNPEERPKLLRIRTRLRSDSSGANGRQSRASSPSYFAPAASPRRAARAARAAEKERPKARRVWVVRCEWLFLPADFLGFLLIFNRWVLSLSIDGSNGGMSLRPGLFFWHSWKGITETHGDHGGSEHVASYWFTCTVFFTLSGLPERMIGFWFC